MKKETKQLHEWYQIVQRDQETLDAWAEAVMADPENGINYTRLGNCAARSMQMMLRLAERDSNPETMDRVLEAMQRVLSERSNS